MQTITSKEFVHTFCDVWNSSDRRICFILGAGASKSSGIRTAGELARQWLEEIKARMQDKTASFTAFLKENGIDENSPEAHYSRIYEDRFKFDYDAGFEFINREMEMARPGYGYSVLAQILCEKQHNIIITTNFDNLAEEALYIYTNKRPLICGHESLAVFAKPSVKRPLIVKIHRDRFFRPQSLPNEIKRINKLWTDALNDIFSNSMPVFLGYGGNDGSLMGYLENIRNFQNIFWCERKGVKVSERVRKLLERHNGKLVEIEGFDEIMFLLQDGLRLNLLDKEIVEIAQKRATEYQETVEKIRASQAASKDIDVQKAAERLVDKAGEDWWALELKAQAAKNDEEKERIYLDALKALPESGELHGNYARFLHVIKRDIAQAEKYYLKAMKLNPGLATTTGNYATLLHKVTKQYDEAEKYYKKALEIDPNNALHNGNYALFLQEIKNNTADAERHYMKALKLEPDHLNNNYNYAVFLKDAQMNYDESEKYLAKVLKIDPNHANAHATYAIILDEVRHKYDEAEKYYLKSLKLHPDSAIKHNNYASFLESRERYKEAQDYYLKALKLDPDLELAKNNYEKFLKKYSKQLKK